MDEAREELLRSFPGELAPGEALMYAHGWTVGVVREGLQALAAEEGLESSGLQDVDVWRWLRGEVYPRESLERLCRLFRCHQAQLGWPPRGNDLPISFRPGTPANVMVPPPPLPVPSGHAGDEPWADGRQDWAAWFGVELSRLIALSITGREALRASRSSFWSIRRCSCSMPAGRSPVGITALTRRAGSS